MKRPYRGIATCFALLAFTLLSPAVSAYPWPVERGVEFEDLLDDDFESRVESATEQNIQEEVEENLVETVESTIDSDIETTLEGALDVALDASVEEVVENAVAESVAGAVEAATEAEVAAAAEVAVEAAVEDSVADSVAVVVEAATEAGVAAAAEVTVEEAVEDSLTESVALAIEASAEAEVAAAAEVTVEASIETAVADAVEDSLARNVDSAVNETIDISLEDSLEDSLDESVDEAVSSVIDDAVTGQLVEDIENSVAQTVENSLDVSADAQIEDAVATGIESSLEEAVETAVAQSTENAAEESVASALADAAEANFDERFAGTLESRLETEIDEIVDGLESALEIDEDRILKEQWLVMAEPDVFDVLTARGYIFDSLTDLPGLGLRLAQVAAPSSFDISEVRDGVIEVVGKDRAEVDLNHIYTAGAPGRAMGEDVMPRAAIEWPLEFNDTLAKIGIIDSQVDISHPAFTGSNLQTRTFVKKGSESPGFHGTAIASIIGANSEHYLGLIPNAELYAASVFEVDGDRGEIASTVSLLRALDWLISSDVEVINISLAGPANRLLERALASASAKNVVVMAAAGNGGPAAAPMYPAAYDNVVAVTAVDAEQRVFRLANRGDYLLLAAPGVNIRHAQNGGGYIASSGTSFAVPFAVAAAANLGFRHPGSDVVAPLLAGAKDLGPPGKDAIYGHGLLSPKGS